MKWENFLSIDFRFVDFMQKYSITAKKLAIREECFKSLLSFKFENRTIFFRLTLCRNYERVSTNSNGFEQVRTDLNKFERVSTISNGFQQVHTVLIQGRFVNFMQKYKIFSIATKKLTIRLEMGKFSFDLSSILRQNCERVSIGSKENELIRF